MSIDNDNQNDDINLRAREERLKEDFIVLDDVHGIPWLYTEYHTHYYYIGMCLQGCTRGQYNYRDTEFMAGDICWIMPDHVLSHDYVSDDYRVLSVFFSKELFQKLKEKGALGMFHYPVQAVIASLTPEQFEVLANGFRMMGRLASCNHPKRDELLTAMCRIQSALGDEFILQQRPDLPLRKSRHDELFEKFYELVVNHYRESREVTFYARKLCLTPKYFATVIKQTTGMAASEWINRYVMVEAKWLLRTQKTIQQIALHLGFTEQGSFSRFFKKYEGITPTAFREKT